MLIISDIVISPLYWRGADFIQIVRGLALSAPLPAPTVIIAVCYRIQSITSYTTYRLQSVAFARLVIL